MKTVLRIFLKGMLLFLVVNLAFGAGGEIPLGRLSLYNRVLPGRSRFPFGENPQEAYNFSLSNLDALFAAHALSREKAGDEYRVFIVGDSSVWGTLLLPEETLSGQLDALNFYSPDGRRVRFYNLGYPTISLMKDLLILDRVKNYAPDQIIWLVTLEAFPRDKQLTVPLVQDNPGKAKAIIEWYHLDLDGAQLNLPTFWKSTIVGRRKELADLLRLQMYGAMFAATGIDQVYPADYPRAQVNLDSSTQFHGDTAWEGNVQDRLAFEALLAAVDLLDGVPLLVVNEPILVSTGINSNVRYNFYYPRWAYDRYRAELTTFMHSNQIDYLDAWNMISPDRFTNSAIHLDHDGETQLAELISYSLQSSWEKSMSFGGP